MRPTPYVTAALLLAAFATVGCSKRGESSAAGSGSPDAEKTRPITAPVATAGTPSGESEFGATAAPATTGPMSFADGQAAYQARNYREAAAIFEAYTERRPDNAWGHYMLALSAWKDGDFQKSEQAFDKALGIDPRHVKSLVNLSRVLIDQKRYDEAIDRLTRASAIDPDSADVHRLLGRTYHAQGLADEAVDAYRRAIELNERDAWSMNNLGLLFLEAARPEEALPLLVQAVELRTDVPEFHNNLGMALEHTGRFRAAATAYGGALSADPRHEKAKQNLARVEAVKGGPDEPFERDHLAKDSIEGVETAGDEKTARK